MLSQILMNTSAEDLDCQVHSTLDSISSEDLSRLFPSIPDSVEMIQFVEESGFEGFNFYHIVVYQNNKPILLLPLFETSYNLSTFLEGKVRRVVHFLSHGAGRLLRPRVLAVGFVESEWGEIGFDRGVTTNTLNQAWDLALKKLQALAARLDIDILAFANFNSEGGSIIPTDKLNGFSEIKSVPSAQLPISYESVEDYLKHLSKNTRKNLRRKLRKASEIQMTRVCDPAPWLEDIYRFYLAQVECSQIVFGVCRQEFFKEVCKRVPGAEYVLYFLGGKLIGFNLVMVKPDCLVDKCFGMDFKLGREFNLYFVSWIENIRYCIEHNISLYHVGQHAEQTKARLGSKFFPGLILFKHRNPLLHRLLSALREQLSYQAPIELPQVYLGSMWEKTLPFRRETQIQPAFSW